MTNKEKAIIRLYSLPGLKKEVELKFGTTGYNIFVFGSYITTGYVEGESDIDIAVYSEDFGVYLKNSSYLEEYFNDKGIKSDIFYIDTSVQAPIYCAPLKSQVQFTDYYPEELVKCYKACKSKLDERKCNYDNFHFMLKEETMEQVENTKSVIGTIREYLANMEI